MQKNRRSLPLEIVFSIAVLVLGVSGFMTRGQATESKLDQGSKLLREHRMAEAKVIFEDYITEKPSPQRLYDVAKAYEKVSEWGQATQYHQQVLKQRPKSAQAWTELALAHYENKKTDDAIDALRSALSFSGKNGRSYIVLANIYEKLGNRYEARIIYGDMLKKKIEPAFASSRLCHLFAIESYFDEALKHCRQAVDRDPKDMNSLVTYGQVLVDKGEKSKGLFELARAAARFKNEAMPFRVRGMIYLEDGNFALARKDLGTAVGLDPLDSESAVNLGHAFFEAGLYDQALIAYTEAARLDKRYTIELSKRSRMLSIKKETTAFEKYKERLSQL